MDEDGELMFEKDTDLERYCVGIPGSHLVTAFQCDLCIFRTLFDRDPLNVTMDKDNVAVIRRLNLDAIWSREPSTIDHNRRTISAMVNNCIKRGCNPKLPPLGPFPIEDVFGFTVAFSMLIQSRNKGRHSVSYTQFATIRHQRSAYSNLYMSSALSTSFLTSISTAGQNKAHLTSCPTNSVWFTKWSRGCETRMGYIVKQNKALTMNVLKAMINKWVDLIRAEDSTFDNWRRNYLIMGLAYSVITFVGSFRGSEGLKVDFLELEKNFNKGDHPSGTKVKGLPPHVIIPLRGRFKGETGERCHLFPMTNCTKSNLKIRDTLKLFLNMRKGIHQPRITPSWAFVNSHNQKMSFEHMNNLVLDCLELVSQEDHDDELDLHKHDIREDYSINRSFRRGSTSHAQNQGIPEDVINRQNRWTTVENAKGRRPKFNMVELYSDIEQLVPSMVRYSELL